MMENDEAASAFMLKTAITSCVKLNFFRVILKLPFNVEYFGCNNIYSVYKSP